MPTQTYDYSMFGPTSIGPADFRIECKDFSGSKKTSNRIYVFKIHKAVVRGHSAYLDMLIDGGFKEGEENCVRKQGDPAFIATILWSMYARDPNVNFSSINIDDLFEKIPVAKTILSEFCQRFFAFAETIEEWHVPRLHGLVREMIRTVSRLPGKEDPLRVSWQRSLEDGLIYAFDSTPNLPELQIEEYRQLFAHMLNDSLDQQDKCLVGQFWEKTPKLGLYLYNDLVEQRKTTYWPCTNCKKLKSGTEQVVIFPKIVKNGGMSVEPVTCDCGFRGLCSENCKANEAFLSDLQEVTNHNHGLFCRSCCKTVLKSGSDIYLRDTGLGWGKRFKFWSYHCDKGHWHAQLRK